MAISSGWTPTSAYPVAAATASHRPLGGARLSDLAVKQEVLDQLCRGGARFHGWADDVYMNWQLGPEGLGMILERVGTGDRTLETGCGYSTVVFALTGARHTVVSPAALEHDRIRAWCDAHGVSTESVTFVVGHSQDVLPTLPDEPLDFALVDGAHAFPLPFLDWYYTASRLRPGGLLVVDDTHIRTGDILRSFMRAESTRWRLVQEFPTTEVFEKLASDVIPHEDWCGQPYCARTRRVPGAPLWPRVRSRIRLRTRLRGAAGRLRGGRGPAGG